MWDTFIPDLLVALVGAVLTVLIAFVTYKVNARVDETKALNSLIEELHRRRALAPGDDQPIPGAAQSDDFVRANASVLSMREEIRTTRDRVRQLQLAQLPLSEMTRACNRYLEMSAIAPERYARLLGELRKDLDRQVRALAATRRRVPHLVPGDGAF